MLPENGIAKLSLSMAAPTVYTSYWGNAAKLKKAGIVLVAICQHAPRFISTKDVKPYKKLAPSAAMLAASKAGTMSREEFGERYEDILGGCNRQEVYDEL